MGIDSPNHIEVFIELNVVLWEFIPFILSLITFYLPVGIGALIFLDSVIFLFLLSLRPFINHNSLFSIAVR